VRSSATLLQTVCSFRFIDPLSVLETDSSADSS
jgi:hypothetical protein